MENPILSGTTLVPNVSTNLSFCGFPPFCSLDAAEKCLQTKLQDCSQCSPPLAYGLLAIISFLGVIITFVNIVVIIVISSTDKKDRTKRDYVKLSLAFADILKGVGLLAVSMPNLILTLGVTSTELFRWSKESLGSPVATAGGVLSVFFYSSSLYHLTYMSIHRLVAIKWPFKYRSLSVASTSAHLLAIWTFSLVAASFAAWNHNAISFSYSVVTFQFFFAFEPGRIRITQLLPLVLLFILPYFVTVIITLVTTHSASQQLKISRSLRASTSSHSSRAQRFRQEVVLFRVTSFMTIGYTILVVPTATVIISFSRGWLNCNNITVPYFVCYYLSTSSGLVNYLVYNSLDEAFRKKTISLFTKKILRRKSQNTQKECDERLQ